MPDRIPPPETRLSVRLTPRASANAVVRYENDILSLRLAAPPVDGAANAACSAFVAELLGLRPGQPLEEPLPLEVPLLLWLPLE